MKSTLAQRPLLSQPAWVAGGSLAAIAVLVALLWSPWERRGGSTKPLVLYCAAGMSKPIQELLKDYERSYGIQVEVTFDGSGKLLSTLRANGGQGDLYLAADASHIRQAQALGLVEETFAIAVLRPVLAVNDATHAKLEKLGKPIRSAKDLLRSDLRVVLANPELASIGQLGKQVLARLGIWAKLEKDMREQSARVSTVGTVQEVAQIVQTRDDYVGILWSAVAKQIPGLQSIAPPEFAAARESLQLGVLAMSAQPAAALKLARFLSAADRGLAVFQNHHYEPVPAADRWEEKPTLHLAAGAMLQPALDDAVAAFEFREGIKVKTTYAGCGHLVAMMKAIMKGDNQQAFPDVYFSCDTSFLDMVQPWFEAGHTLTNNDLVILVAKDNPHNVTGLADLAQRQELRVGLGHPTHCALGKLTDDLLKKLGLHDAINGPERSAPVVHADAGHQLVGQMVVKALDAAVVYRSNAMSHPGNVDRHFDIIELDDGPAARQPLAIAKDSPRRQLAQRFVLSLQTTAQAERFRTLGFGWLLEAK